ncbi:hypothetical protein T190_23165 [Sinorhizobium meliloti CCBAU 01290]|nr:hypothetical protein T190_23165 [Sinorhizobium meliloti CCBAU 01290]
MRRPPLGPNRQLTAAFVLDLFLSSDKMFLSANKRGMSTGAVSAAFGLILNDGVFDRGFHPPDIIAIQGDCHG